MNKISIFILFIITFGFSCISFAKTADINWVGCGISKKAYMTAMAKNFTQETGIIVNLQGGGATKGIREVAAGKADIGGSCRYYLPKNAAESGIAFEPLAWDALAVIVHKENPLNNITLQQVRGIYTGKITNWKQLGGADQDIKLLIRNGKISGVGYTIRKLIFADQNKEFVSKHRFKSTGPIEKAIEKDSYAISITGISSARLRDIKILSLNGREPNYKNIRNGEYALYRPLFLTYHPKDEQIDEIKKFIKYAHSSTGRAIMKKNNVVPYLEALRLIMKQARQDQIAQSNNSQDVTH